MMESGAFQTDAAVVVLPSANQFVKVPFIDTRGAGFSQVLLEIDNELVKRDIRALKFLCRDTLTGAKLQSITRGLDLFSHLEYNGVICREDILFLGELLFRIGRVDCLRKLGYSWEELNKHLQSPQSTGRQIPPYRVLLFEISEDLSKGEVQELKFLMKKELSQTRLAEIKDGADIFVSMEQAGILTPTNLNYLIEYFGYIDRNDLRNIAIAFQLKVQNQHAAQATDETQPLQQQQQCEQQQWDQQQEQQFKQLQQQLEQQQKQQQEQQWKQQQEQHWKQQQEQQWKQQQEQQYQNQQQVQQVLQQLKKQQLQQQQPQGSPSYFTNQSAQPSKGHQVHDDYHAGLKKQMSDHKYKVPEMHEMEDVERKTFLTSTGDAPIVARSEEHTFNPRPAEDLTIPVPMDTATNIPIHVLEASESEALTPASVAQRLSGLQISGDVQPTMMDEEFPAYKMDKNPRGECIIINNEHFEQNPLPGCKKLPNRDGTQFDEDKLGEIWTNLHFKVTIFKDRSSLDIMNIINHFSRIDHKEYDCVVVCILSHGLTGLLYGTDGKTVKISDLTGFFRGINCPSLIGKPKLFFIQACQGKDKNEAVEIPETDGPAPVDEGSIAVTLPNEADFLLGYATMPGYVSYRSRSSGSWYISKLAEVLQKHASRYDLMSMLTKVNEEVSKATVTKDGRSYAQSPAPLTSLRKKVYFY